MLGDRNWHMNAVAAGLCAAVGIIGTVTAVMVGQSGKGFYEGIGAAIIGYLFAVALALNAAGLINIKYTPPQQSSGLPRSQGSEGENAQGRE